jgi:cytochrome P450
MTTDIDISNLIDPESFARDGYPHELWKRLRAEAPVARFEPPGYEPFWTITKHADIIQVSTQPLRFSSAPGLTLRRAGAPPVHSEMVVMVDPPRHGPLRRVVSGGFTPRAVRARRADIERIAVEILDEAMPASTSGEFDFVERIAAPFPLAVIAWKLGVPRSDWPLLFRWTNEVIGKEDPEYRQPGESPGRTMKRARGELHAYIEDMIEQRRRDPGDDLVSELIHGEIDGAPLTHEQLLAYCEVLIEAGNETTRNAISGGLIALGEHGDEFQKLRGHPELLPEAVEEILRWVSPISYFTRTATQDSEVRGQTIAAGEQVALYYASANRDEEVFADPFAFRVDRRPNPHLAFGFGEHFCLGAHLARVELETMLRHLLARLEWFEMAGPVQRLGSTVNGSIKRLPLRYRMK